MRILNICVFASANDTGILILYFTKLISEFKKIGKHCKIFVFSIKLSCQNKESPPFLDNPSSLFQPHPF